MHDAVGRLLSLDAPGTAHDITYTYDTCPGGAGRLCAATRGSGADAETVTWAYNTFGDITAHQQVAYAYDAAGRLVTLTYPSGAVVRLAYDAAGNVNAVSLASTAYTGPLASNITYAPFGPVVDLTYGNGLGLSQALDTAYRLTRQQVIIFRVRVKNPMR